MSTVFIFARNTLTTTLDFLPNSRARVQLNIRHSDWRAVRDEISRHRADVIVLNEFGDTEYEDQQGRMMTRLPCFNEQVDELARALESDGYAILGCDVEWPTVVATRLTVVEATAERLSHARGAAYVRMRLKSCDDDDDDDHGNTPRELVVFGTHFCHMSANNRKREADALLGAVDRLVGPRAATDVPVIVCGDLNQQRQRDLHPDDWTSLCKSKARRGEKPFEDGVLVLLRHCRRSAQLARGCRRTAPNALDIDGHRLRVLEGWHRVCWGVRVTVQPVGSQARHHRLAV